MYYFASIEYRKLDSNLFPTDLTGASKTYALACLRQRVVEEGVWVWAILTRNTSTPPSPPNLNTTCEMRHCNERKMGNIGERQRERAAQLLSPGQCSTATLFLILCTFFLICPAFTALAHATLTLRVHFGCPSCRDNRHF